MLKTFLKVFPSSLHFSLSPSLSSSFCPSPAVLWMGPGSSTHHYGLVIFKLLLSMYSSLLLLLLLHLRSFQISSSLQVHLLSSTPHRVFGEMKFLSSFYCSFNWCPRCYLWSCWHSQESKSMAHSVVMEIPWASTLALPFSLSISVPKVPCPFITLCSSPKALLRWFCVLLSVKFSPTAGWVWEVLGEGKVLLSQRIGKRDNDLQSEWLKIVNHMFALWKLLLQYFCSILVYTAKKNSISFYLGWAQKNLILLHL